MIKHVVLDIEGTTSPLSAVHDVLFPYARDRIAPWITDGRPLTAAVASDVHAAVGRRLTAAEVAEVLVSWHDANLKVPALKSLHGVIWAEGFNAGVLEGVVYADVPVALADWEAKGVGRWIYSSGSVLAQKLWFSRTDHGDLLGFVDGHFDTVTGGPKKERASYDRIAAAIGADPSELLFLSDAVAELDAAREAGWHTVGVSRPEDGNPDVGTHRAIKDFGEL